LAASQRRPCCASMNGHCPVGLVGRQWVAVDWAELVHCVAVALTMSERADMLHHDNAPAHSTALVQAFLTKHHINQVSQPSYSPDLAPWDFWLFPKLKSPLNGRRFVNEMVT
jgi:hypothetical protein